MIGHKLSAGAGARFGPTKGSEAAAPFHKRRRRRDNELGQVLLRKGVITPEQLRAALRLQAEAGGHLGQILKQLGACDSRAITDALVDQVRTARSRGTAGGGWARQARENPAMGGLQVRCRPGLVTLLLMSSDLVALSAALAVLSAMLSKGALTPAYYGVFAIIPFSMALLAARHHYAVTPPSPPDELRSITYTITLIFTASWISAVAARTGPFASIPHAAYLCGWLAAVLLVLTLRGIVRSRFATRPWWGIPVVVLGAGKVGRAVVTTLQGRPQLGLRPVAVLDDDMRKLGSVRAAWGENDIVIEPVRQVDDEDIESPSQRFAVEQFAEVEHVPVVGALDLAPALAQRLDIHTVVIAMPDMDSDAILAIIERFAQRYTNILVIPDLFNLAHFGAPTRYLGGVLGIEVQRQLLLAGPRFAKRMLDLVLTTIGGLLILPILVTLCALIRLDSRGPAFYRQKRLGQDGVRFQALKFRTMYVDAEARLKDLLSSDPHLKSEYDSFHKLQNDPRVTRLGRFLRKYSLDELPQLWNVIVGEMSLVGPRPYLEREIPEMAQKEAIILRVKPGITGIWQVTWRNESTFDQRVNLDVEYVRNWSPWLDVYVLARTVPVVLGGTGS